MIMRVKISESNSPTRSHHTEEEQWCIPQQLTHCEEGGRLFRTPSGALTRVVFCWLAWLRQETDRKREPRREIDVRP
jgi:hypothetical protein